MTTSTASPATTRWTRAQWSAESDRIGKLLAAKKAELGLEHIKTRFRWNNTFTRRMGDAKADGNRDGGMMRFSTPLWPVASVAERDETVLHEFAHVVVECQHGPRFTYRRGRRVREVHDSIFTSMLVKLGGTGARTHKVDRTHVKRVQARFGGACPGCGAEVSFSRAVRTKWMRGDQVRRHRCGETLDATWARRAGRV